MTERNFWQKIGMKIRHPVNYRWKDDHLHVWEEAGRETVHIGYDVLGSYKFVCKGCGKNKERPLFSRTWISDVW